MPPGGSQHVIHGIGRPPRVPLNQNAFFGPRVPSMQKRPQVGVAYQPDFF